MKKIFRNSARKVTALILLGFFIFSFLHSELGFLNYDDSNHGGHDYCEIIKNTSTHSKTLREIQPKLEINKDICIHCFEEIEAQETQTSFERTYHHLQAKSFTDLYLFNRTFLI
ncbi:MAG: hypothetical protein C0412_20550 [Flavobacterium sp.]|nr:hypothetical protein [Flavobacterium sp.]